MRFVLLKGIDERGVRFFTNHESRKARELAANARAALAALWKALNRQVRLEGAVERLDDDESDAYFATRARGCRLGAWASASPSCPTARRSRPGCARSTSASRRRDPAPAALGRLPARPGRDRAVDGPPDRLHDREELRRGADGAWRVRRLSP